MSQNNDNPDDTRTRRTGDPMPWSDDHGTLCDYASGDTIEDNGTDANGRLPGSAMDPIRRTGDPISYKACAGLVTITPYGQALGHSERTIDEAHQADAALQAHRLKVLEGKARRIFDLIDALNARLRILEVAALAADMLDPS